MKIDEKYPSVADMAVAAQKRVPKFAYDYLAGGIGREVCLAENIRALDAIKLTPRYLSSRADRPDCSQQLFGTTYDAPFGVAPVGLSGLIWPRASEHLARAAKAHNIPFTLSGFATSSVEDIAAVAGSCAWYQHYVTVDDSIDSAMIERAKAAGGEVLIITVDIPTPTRRDHDIKNGLSVPPRVDLQTLWQVAMRPRWALATAAVGPPRFRNLTRHIPERSSLQTVSKFLGALVDAHVSMERLKQFRDRWPGKLVVKGLLDPDEATACKALGVDGIVVSNHGGRQLDAAPTAPALLGLMRQAVGPDMPILADGGVRNGLDIVRLLASGADFVLLGRAFMFALAAMGPRGADHVMTVLKAEFRATMGQIGCPKVTELPDFLKG